MTTADLVAVVRGVSQTIAHCELTHLARESIDLARARAQHADYVAALSELGCDVVQLPADDRLPDCVFVEDAAVVLDEVAVLCRPGAVSRRDEVPAVAEALAPHRPLARIAAPATMDGGDVLVLGRRVLVGLTSRTDRTGVEQLRACLAPHGYEVAGVAVRGCLHLKSAATEVGDGLVLANPARVDGESLGAVEIVAVDPREPDAANALRVGGTVLFPARFPRTLERLLERGLEVREVVADELAKAEGALTCCSLLFRAGE